MQVVKRASEILWGLNRRATVILKKVPDSVRHGITLTKSFQVTGRVDLELS